MMETFAMELTKNVERICMWQNVVRHAAYFLYVQNVFKEKER
nr:hypothetical protein [uncultured Prevotella sp.]